jgi:hypothetical protein
MLRVKKDLPYVFYPFMAKNSIFQMIFPSGIGVF